MPEIMGLPPEVLAYSIPYHISLSVCLASSFNFAGGNRAVLQVYVRGLWRRTPPVQGPGIVAHRHPFAATIFSDDT
jgi:hypothetical protein